MKVLFISLGCDKNLVDSEMMLGMLVQKGYAITDDETEAEAVVVNTCCFINDAKQESINTLLEMAELRKSGTVKALIAAGCLAQRYQEEIQKEMLDIQLSINHYVFFDITDNKEEKFYDKLENDKPQWKNFIDSISILKNAMEKRFKAHHFLYELLRKITDPKIYKDEVKYSNAVLYHLSPSYLNSSDKGLREAELLLIAILLKQVSEKEGKQYELKFDCKQKKKLENYVRLLLLFSDSNLKIKDEDKEFVKNTFDIKKIRSCVFNRVLRYLYTNNLDIKDEKENKKKKLKDIFVREEEYVSDLKDNKKKRMKIKVYRTLPIRSSMFYRIKNKIRKQDNKYIYHIITNIQNRTQDEIKQIEELHKKEYKAPPSLYFDTEGVDEIVNKIDKDYIDSLLIFYQFNQQSIQYKKIYPSEKISKKQKEC